MTQVMNKTKLAKMGAFLMFLILTLVTFMPTITYATGGFSMDGMNITINESGSMEVTGENFEENRAGAWNALLAKYQGLIAGLSGLATATMVVLFMKNFLSLGAAGNPQARTNALNGCLWTGLSATGLGALTVIVGFFYNAI